MANKDSLYKYTKLEFLESTIKNGIFASKIINLNDPYELRNVDKKKFRVVCLTRSNNQKLMWSHYGNGHRGCCVQIEQLEEYGQKDCILKRITYSSNVNNKKNKSNDILQSPLYIKDKKWYKELEVRAVYDGQEKNEKYWNKVGKDIYFKSKIIQVSFGCLADTDEKNYLSALKAIKEYNDKSRKKIKVKKFKMSDDSFKFVYDKNYDYETELERLDKEK